MSSTTRATLTIDQLDVSPLNVRSHHEDANAVAAMEVSILERGLIQALNVHPLKGSKKLGAFAGGRRYRSIRNLVKRGDLPATFPVQVVIYEGYTDVQIIELSLGENILRKDLREYEICTAVARLARRGEDAHAVSAALGQPLRIVKRWLAVGQLAPEIFTAFEKGALPLEDAKAYAATADQALQRATWNELRELAVWQRTPDKIRAALKVGDRRSSRRLRLVGVDAYRAAGGRFELDLFADEADERGRVVDEGILAQLADARLDEVRDATRAATGRDLRFVPAPPGNGYGGTDHTLQVTPRPRDGGGMKLPDGDLVAWIEVNEAGEPQVTYWWSDRKAKHGSAKRDTPRLSKSQSKSAVAIREPSGAGAQAADAQIREELGGTRDAVQIFRSLRRAVLRAMLIDDARAGGTSALDLLVFSQCRQLLAPFGDRTEVGTGVIRGQSADQQEAVGHLRLMPADAVIEGAVRALSTRPWMTDADVGAGFHAYCREPVVVRDLAGAVVAGLSLERSVNADGYHLPLHDALAAELGAADDESVRRYWTPTAELIGLFPRDRQLEIAEPFVDAATIGAWQRLKVTELTPLVLRVVLGTAPSIGAKLQAAAARWVHPLLRFQAVKQPAQPVALELEAAE